MDKSERERRIIEVSEKIDDVHKLLDVKERRVKEATDSSFYGEAEKQMNEWRKYRSELSELKSELATLQKKEKRYKATVKKKQLQSQQTIIESLHNVSPVDTAQTSSLSSADCVIVNTSSASLVESGGSETVSSAEQTGLPVCVLTLEGQNR